MVVLGGRWCGPACSRAGQPAQHEALVDRGFRGFAALARRLRTAFPMARTLLAALLVCAGASGCDSSIGAGGADAGGDPDSKADGDGDGDSDSDSDSDSDADSDSDSDSDADSDSDSDSDADSDADADLPIVLGVDVSVWTKALTDSDVDCLYEEGYRHVIAGTQLLEVTRQQLEIAIRGGMTVDLYIYLYWNESIEDQVGEAIDLVDEFPEIGRVWLDVEEDPAGRSAREIGDLVQEGLDLLGDIPAGIYTGPGFWIEHMDDTDRFTGELLWFAHYDQDATFDSWDDPDDPDHFGAWVTPFAKQYMDNHLRVCDLTLDHDIIRWDQTPTVELDRAVPPDDGDAPPAPTDLRPTGGLQITTEWVRPTAPVIREATSWQVAVESWSGAAWADYFTWDSDVSSVTIYPQLADRTYRFRLRAENTHGWGPWSDWAWFEFGTDDDPPTLDEIQE